MSLSAGTTYDARLIFGDSSAPVRMPMPVHHARAHCQCARMGTALPATAVHATHGLQQHVYHVALLTQVAANRIENLLLHIVRFFCMEEWGIADLDDTSEWLTQLLTAPWAQSERTQQWITDRAAKFGAPTAPSFRALSDHDACNVIEQLWRLVPAALSGFFDVSTTPNRPRSTELVDLQCISDILITRQKLLQCHGIEAPRRRSVPQNGLYIERIHRSKRVTFKHDIYTSILGKFARYKHL